MALDKKDLKKLFPHLYEELESGEVKVPIRGIRKNASEAEGEVSEECACDECIDEEKDVPPTTETPDKLRHFNPQAVDFIRRCDTEAQVEEIITYLEKRGEITHENAAQLRYQLKNEGVRSFGPKKEENHYFKEGGIY